MANAIVTSHDVGEVMVILRSAERRTGAAQSVDAAASTHAAIDALLRTNFQGRRST